MSNIGCTVGYNDFDFCCLHEASQTGENGIRRHIYNICFSFFWAVLSDFGWKLAKRANISKQFFWTNSTWMYKNVKFNAEVKPVEENEKRSPRKVIGWNLLHTVIKVKNCHFFVDNFFRTSLFATMAWEDQVVKIVIPYCTKQQHIAISPSPSPQLDHFISFRCLEWPKVIPIISTKCFQNRIIMFFLELWYSVEKYTVLDAAIQLSAVNNIFPNGIS
jgi:hypothetical protein